MPDIGNTAPFELSVDGIIVAAARSFVGVALGCKEPLHDAAVDTVAKAIENAKGKKVLLHCTVAWRASHMWAAYLVKYKGFTAEEARRQAEAINFNGYRAGGVPFDSLLGATPKPAAAN